jgi:mannose/fructose/N-acetylgalactosamine-specific phosphotransferase system component IIC
MSQDHQLQWMWFAMGFGAAIWAHSVMVGFVVWGLAIAVTFLCWPRF